MAETETLPKPQLPENWREFFPLEHIRQKQEKALDFVFRMINRGVKDIVVAAPTGTGKSAIGAALAFWADQKTFPLAGRGGAYYLCTQKLLQDQLDEDVGRYPPMLRSAASLKSACEYKCPSHGDCATGMARKPPCQNLRQQACTYRRQVQLFLNSSMAVTNYPYFFTERAYLQQFPSRRILIADECHTLENQLLKFVELTVGPEEVETYVPRIGTPPPLPRLEDFVAWVNEVYLPNVDVYLTKFTPESMTATELRAFNEATNHLNKIVRALADIENDPNNWVYWQENVDSLNTQARGLVCYAKPLSAAPFFQDYMLNTSDVRIYLSAFPGTKAVFCRTLGLDPEGTAMLTLGSVFAKEHRPIIASFMGSMSRTNQAKSLPVLFRALAKIFVHHSDTKGIIHCHSYALGKAIFDHFKGTDHTFRLRFPTKADEREKVYREHRETKSPSIIISPSFTEGFDFSGDAARWQVIAKVPYPYLGDRQVAAKKDMDEEWYALKTVSTIIQASGRIVRSETDTGTTYITDSDFKYLWDRWSYLFPSWWTEALVWH